MDTRETYKEKIEQQLSKWRTTIDGLKTKMEQAEEQAKAKLHEQLENLHEKRGKAEKMLEEITTASQEAWESVKTGIEQGWKDLNRTAKNTLRKVREAVASPNRDEEIRQIAYYLWLEEGRPDGRHLEHWLRAESIWRARHEIKGLHEPTPSRAKGTRKRTTNARVATSKKRSRPKEPQS